MKFTKAYQSWCVYFFAISIIVQQWREKYLDFRENFVRISATLLEAFLAGGIKETWSKDFSLSVDPLLCIWFISEPHFHK